MDNEQEKTSPRIAPKKWSNFLMVPLKEAALGFVSLFDSESDDAAAIFLGPDLLEKGLYERHH